MQLMVKPTAIDTKKVTEKDCPNFSKIIYLLHLPISLQV